jgi:hypothetical protein
MSEQMCAAALVSLEDCHAITRSLTEITSLLTVPSYTHVSPTRARRRRLDNSTLPVTSVSASSANLSEALEVLRDDFAVPASNVAEDRAVIWFGSGASSGRLPPLQALLLRLLVKLHENQDPADLNCPYRALAQQIVELTTISGLDLAQDPNVWPAASRDDLLKQLETKYPEVLAIPLQNIGGPQNVPWDFLQLHEVYSDPAITPDAEHRFLALLVAEGAISEIVTTNWDPLIERAHNALGTSPALEIVASNSELNRPCLGTLLLKIHGCAQKMKDNPAQYRQHMIVTRTDITQWTQLPLFQPFKEKVQTILRERPAVFVGLSGQDFNLQALWVTARAGGVAYPYDPPWVVFTATSVGAPQRAIMQALYSQEVYGANAATIESKATLPLYGKPLLGALYVLVLLGKVACIVDRGEDQFPVGFIRALARSCIEWLEHFLTDHYDVIADPSTRWRELASALPSIVARFLMLYRYQSMPLSREAYEPIAPSHVGRMALDPNLPDANLHWLVLAFGILHEGSRAGVWTVNLSVEPAGGDGQLRVDVAAIGTIAVFLLNRADVALEKLNRSGVISAGSGQRSLFIYPSGRSPALPRRSPTRGFPGVASSTAPSEIWLQDIAETAMTTHELLDSLRSELISAQPL